MKTKILKNKVTIEMNNEEYNTMFKYIDKLQSMLNTLHETNDLWLSDVHNLSSLTFLKIPLSFFVRDADKNIKVSPAITPRAQQPGKTLFTVLAYFFLLKKAKAAIASRVIVVGSGIRRQFEILTSSSIPTYWRATYSVELSSLNILTVPTSQFE